MTTYNLSYNEKICDNFVLPQPQKIHYYLTREAFLCSSVNLIKKKTFV